MLSRRAPSKVPLIIRDSWSVSNMFKMYTESLQISSLYQDQIWRDSVPNSGTEYLPGVDLDKWISRRHRDPDQISALFELL